MIEIFSNLSKKEIDIYTLVLASSAISYRMEKNHDVFEKVKDAEMKIKICDKWNIFVAKEDGLKAGACIQNYLEENKSEIINSNSIQSLNKKGASNYPGLIAGLAGSFIIQLFYFITNRLSEEKIIFIHQYSASSFHISDGEIYRAVTALFLHADILHLVGNIAGMVIFASAVISIMGAGTGWLMILFSGIMGNIINAAVYQRAHFSIGSSTAVFGAVGILSACQLIKKLKVSYKYQGAWLPLAGGVALLVMLGSEGKNTDFLAHLFGFLSGIIIGGVYAFFVEKKGKMVYQVISMIAVVCIIAGAWLKLF